MGKVIILLIASLLTVSFTPFEKESGESVKGRESYAKGDMEKASKEFSKAANRLKNNAEAFYDLGNAKLKAGDNEGAMDSYKKSLETGTAGKELKSRIFHNMGNAMTALKKLPDAEKYYIRSLMEKPEADTAENLEIVRRMISQQQEQQQKQDQQKQDQQQNQKQDQKQDQQQDQKQDQQQDQKQDQQQDQKQDQQQDQKQDQQQDQKQDQQQDQKQDQQQAEQAQAQEQPDQEEQPDDEQAAVAEGNDEDEQDNDNKKEERKAVLKQFDQRKNLQISPFMLKKESDSQNGQTW